MTKGARPRNSSMTKGDELYNLYLSARRDAAVKRALAARGIPAKTLEVQAVGESDPVPGSAGDSPQDRRAVVTWH
jgi:outer membrane protein OmpA-like peptidoglycan-associated protein